MLAIAITWSPSSVFSINLTVSKTKTNQSKNKHEHNNQKQKKDIHAKRKTNKQTKNSHYVSFEKNKN
jgi:hypothetical protein